MKTCDYFGIILLVFVIIGFLFNTSNVPFFSYGQEQQSRDTIVAIPKGSANPEVDITNLSPRQWYKPAVITINVNDTVKWINDDTEPHTITSGLGGGLASAATNSKGKPNGFFDSGLFKPGDSWSFKFNKSGTFNYFCTIHPWMEGIINVKGENTNIPPYAVNKNGNRIDKIPSYVL